MNHFYACILFVAGIGTAIPVAAQEDTVEKLSFGAQLIAMSPMFLIILAIFYLLVIQPQNKQQKKHEEFIAGLTKGASVVTTGGLIGRVAGIEKDYILLEVANGVKMKFLTSHVRHAIEKSAS